MTTNMIDSIHATCHNIPAGTRKVAGYGHKIVAVQWASPSSNPDTPLPRSSLTLEQANCDLSVTLDYWHRHRR